MTSLAFFLSGIAALVYQVTWQRILALHSGVGIYSVAVIVAAFMLGLGAGSHAGGVASARAHARRRPAGLCLHRARDRGVRRAERHPLLRLAVRARRAALRAALARGAAARPGARGADVPHGHVAPVPGPRHGAQRAHRGRDRRAAVRGEPRRRRHRRRPHPVGPDPPVRDAGRGAVRRGRQRGRGVDRPRGTDGRRRRRGGRRWRRRPRSRRIRSRSPSGPFSTAWAASARCPSRCCGSASPTWRSRPRPSPSAPSCASTCSGWRRAPWPACRWRGACATRCGSSCAARPGSWCGRARRWSPSPGCRPGSRRFPTLLEYWSAPRPFNLGADWNAGTLILLYVAVPAFLYGVPTFLMGMSFAVLQRAVHDDARTSGRKVGVLQAVQHRGVRGRDADRRPRRPGLVGDDGDAARA